MKGIKFISVFAAVGFVLSFLFGLFSHTSIVSVLLKALLFGVIFGVLGFLINIVYGKFLADDSSDFAGDYTADDDSSAAKTTSSISKGQLVDITIKDEDLEKSEGDNHFIVGENHQMLNESDIKNRNTQGNAQDEGAENNGFVPLKKFETLNGLSGKESVSPNEVTAGSESTSGQVDSISDNIDTLPDMNHLDLTSGNDSDEEELDTSTDSDFVSSANAGRNNGEVPEIKDAALMAKAISSVLSDENAL